jgi:2-haloacid dehalogenase
MEKPGLLAFDVNETLLSLAPLRALFQAKFGSEVSLAEWFARLLHGSVLANALDQFRPFDEIGAESLVMMGRRRGLEVTLEEARSIVATLAEAPPHPDVPPAVERLADAGVRMIALTNGSTTVANAQVSNAGLAHWLERVISVDEVGRFKPDPLPYRHAAAAMGVGIDDMTLVAAHDWDCAGAMATGARAVFVARPDALWGLPSPPPEHVMSDLSPLAAELGR